MTTDPKDTVRRVILMPLTTLFRPPAHLASDEQGKLYLNALTDAVASMRPEQFELEESWNRVVREHKTTTWPTPAVICQALTEYRQKVARVAQQERLVERPKAIEADDGAYDPVAEAEALRQLEAMRRDPRTAHIAGVLQDMYERKWGRKAVAA